MKYNGGSITEETRRATSGRDPHDQDSYYIPEQILKEFQVHHTTATKSPSSPRDRQQQLGDSPAKLRDSLTE